MIATIADGISPSADTERQLSRSRGGNRIAGDAIAEESLYFRRAEDIKGPPAVVGIYCRNVVLVDEETESSANRKRAGLSC